MTLHGWALYTGLVENTYVSEPSVAEISAAILRLDGEVHCSLSVHFAGSRDTSTKFILLGGLDHRVWLSLKVKEAGQIELRRFLANKTAWDDPNLIVISFGQGEEDVYPAFCAPAEIAATAVELYITKGTLELPFAEYEWVSYEVYSDHIGELSKKWREIQGDIKTSASE